MSFNSFAGIVRVGTDVEVKTAGKSEFVKCRAVHTYSYKDDSDVWLGLTFWGQKAAAAQKMVKKGDQLFVKGTLQFRTYQEKLYVELSVDDFSKVGGKPSGKPRPETSGTETEAVGVSLEEDIPF